MRTIIIGIVSFSVPYLTVVIHAAHAVGMIR
jgi:hypothetical protein